MRNTATLLLTLVLLFLLIIGIKVALTIIKIFAAGAFFGILLFVVVQYITKKKDKDENS